MTKIYQKFECVDGHTCGNPVRLVKSGGPELEGNSMSERRQHFLRDYDWIRRGLMFEPRGHDLMSGSILYPPSDPSNDIGVLYIETSGCLPMCGHGTIGTVTMMIQEKLVIPQTEGKLSLETPAGIVKVRYTIEGDRVTSVKLTNVKSFLHSENLIVECPELGKLSLDVAYGGNFYAIVDPQKNFSGIQNHSADQLVSWSRSIREILNEQHTFVHPEDHTISGLSHLLWTGDTLSPNATARSAVFYGDKAIDRSPCGTGTSARMAQWHAKGKLKLQEEFTHESIIGSAFIGRIEKETTLGQFKAIIPSVEGWARTTGYNTITIDENDPYAFGFQVI